MRPGIELDEGPDPPPVVPSDLMTDDEVAATEFEYSTRHPNDRVISGPLGDGGGPGRWFATWSQAGQWAVKRYGEQLRARVVPPDGGGYRWAFLVRFPDVGGNADE